MIIPDIQTKSCPLCNGAALSRVRCVPGAHHHELKFTIKCLKCDCSRTTTLEVMDLSFEEIIREIKKAVDEWNRRVDTQCEQ